MRRNGSYYKRNLLVAGLAMGFALVPLIFILWEDALMIGFGRAVGESMIVLMATGNTAQSHSGLSSGLRALSANIAIEMPEAAAGSVHYRILFLSALRLLLFTLIINTLAELIRQQLRQRYSQREG